MGCSLAHLQCLQRRALLGGALCAHAYSGTVAAAVPHRHNVGQSGANLPAEQCRGTVLLAQPCQARRGRLVADRSHERSDSLTLFERCGNPLGKVGRTGRSCQLGPHHRQKSLQRFENPRLCGFGRDVSGRVATEHHGVLKLPTCAGGAREDVVVDEFGRRSRRLRALLGLRGDRVDVDSEGFRQCACYVVGSAAGHRAQTGNFALAVDSLREQLSC